MKTEKNILVAFLLNLLFSIFELVGGIYTKSIAIISDSIHDFGDSISIGVSYFLESISKKKADDKYTYGYTRYSVLGAFITNSILIAGAILVIYNSIIRILNPVDINYNGMIIFALVGVIVNFIAAYTTRGGDSLNQKAVNLHMLEDVLGWALVLIGAVIIKFTKLNIIDPIMSILLSLFIVMHAGKNFEVIVNLFLLKLPSNVELDKIKKEVLKVKGVVDVHHIHVWSIDGYSHNATMHVINNGKNKTIKVDIRNILNDFNINHVTLELEDELEECSEKTCKTNIKKENRCHHH